MTSTNFEEAYKAASRGWSIIPIVKGSKKPLHDWKDRQTARLTIDEIEQLYNSSPDAGLGIVTGKLSGLAVLDVDPKSGGIESLEELEQEHGPLPGTITCRTGNGGFHYYFTYPAEGIRNSTGMLGSGLDIRGEGGYVVAPPSVHPNGNVYEWVKGKGPDQVSLGYLPKWILKASTLPVKEPEQRSADAGKHITRGMRRSTLLSRAGSMHHIGMAPASIEAALLAENDARCDPPLPLSEVLEISEDIPVRYEAGEPAVTSLNFITPDQWLQREQKPINWIVEGLLAAGTLTMISAPPKAGKSTFARAAGAAVSKGEPFLGRDVTQGSVFYMAVEERPEVVQDSFRRLGVKNDTPLSVHFGRVDRKAVFELEKIIQMNQPDLLFVDTVGRVRPGKVDLTDYIAVGEWLEPFLYMAHETDTCVCLLYHDRKDGSTAVGYEAVDAVLGSTGVGAIVDQLISIRRDRTDRRSFQTIGRFEDIPGTVFELDGETHQIHSGGTAYEIDISSKQDEIVSLLVENGKLSGGEIRKALSGRAELKSAALRTIHERDEEILRTGSAKAGDPFFYEIINESGGK